MTGQSRIFVFLLWLTLLPFSASGVDLTESNRQLPLKILYQTPLSTPAAILSKPTILDHDGVPLPWHQLTLTNQADHPDHWLLTQPLWQAKPRVYRQASASGLLIELEANDASAVLPVRYYSLTLQGEETVTLYFQGGALPATLWRADWWNEWQQGQRNALLLMCGAMASLLLCIGLLSLVPALQSPAAAAPLFALLAMVQYLIPSFTGSDTAQLWPLAITLAQVCINYPLSLNAQLTNRIRFTIQAQLMVAVLLGILFLVFEQQVQPLMLPVLLLGNLLGIIALLQLLLEQTKGQWLMPAGQHLLLGIYTITLASMLNTQTLTITAIQPLLMALLVFLSQCQRLAAADESRGSRSLRDIARSNANEYLPQRHEALQNQFRDLEMKHRLLQEKNAIDFLTGLRNRQFFDRQFNAEMARSCRENIPLSLMLIDIDHFKSVNDKYGHRIGDEVLIAVAKRFYYVVKRPADAICRYGGEEFAIILPNTHGQGALHIAEAIMDSIRQKPVNTEQGEIWCTVSIGIASTVHKMHVPESKLIEDADMALYRAKEKGRDRIELAPSQPYAVREERMIGA